MVAARGATDAFSGVGRHVSLSVCQSYSYVFYYYRFFPCAYLTMMH